MVILVWRTDRDGNPTGEEWTFRSDSLRDCIAHVSYLEKGTVSQNKKIIYFPNGDKGFAQILEK